MESGHGELKLGFQTTNTNSLSPLLYIITPSYYSYTSLPLPLDSWRVTGSGDVTWPNKLLMDRAFTPPILFPFFAIATILPSSPSLSLSLSSSSVSVSGFVALWSPGAVRGEFLTLLMLFSLPFPRWCSHREYPTRVCWWHLHPLPFTRLHLDPSSIIPFPVPLLPFLPLFLVIPFSSLSSSSTHFSGLFFLTLTTLFFAFSALISLMVSISNVGRLFFSGIVLSSSRQCSITARYSIPVTITTGSNKVHQKWKK